MNRGPRNATASELAKVGVTITDEIRFWLQCNACGSKWRPDYPSFSQGERWHNGYWRCENGCNALDHE